MVTRVYGSWKIQYKRPWIAIRGIWTVLKVNFLWVSPTLGTGPSRRTYTLRVKGVESLPPSGTGSPLVTSDESSLIEESLNRKL